MGAVTALTPVTPDFSGTGTILNPATGVAAGEVQWTDPADVPAIAGPEVFALAQGAREVSEAVIDNVDVVQFTGSTATGRKVMERAARRLTPVSLESGGKDPMIVLDDADVELAAHAAVWGAMFNAGQTCVSVGRVYVLEPVHDQFVKAVVRDVQALEVGAGDGHSLGGLIDEQQLAVTERHVREAVAAGARVLTGGKRADKPGSFFEPTVLADVDHSMTCMTAAGLRASQSAAERVAVQPRRRAVRSVGR